MGSELCCREVNVINNIDAHRILWMASLFAFGQTLGLDPEQSRAELRTLSQAFAGVIIRRVPCTHPGTSFFFARLRPEQLILSSPKKATIRPSDILSYGVQYR